MPSKLPVLAYLFRRAVSLSTVEFVHRRAHPCRQHHFDGPRDAALLREPEFFEQCAAVSSALFDGQQTSEP